MDAEPLLDHRRVDAAEVGGHLQVAVVQIDQARVPAIQPTLDTLTNDEHRCRGAVIGAETGILLDPSTKFREHHDGHVARSPDPLQILDKSTDRVGGVGKQPRVRVRLVHVSVERIALIADVIQAGRHLSVDQGRHSP